MASDKIKAGVVGCGVISGIYLKNLSRFDHLEVAACADIVRKRAETRAAEYQIPKVYSPAEMMSDPEISLIVNLTTPDTHAQIGMAAVNAGKSVYNEKPLTISQEAGRLLLQLAGENHVQVGCAPDTFLGAGLQGCRAVLDQGEIGHPVAATAFMMSPGHESWHPDPEFYYQPGGGPLFDMGPYYLTALVSLLGPVRRVTGSAQISSRTRKITSQPKFGETINVQVPTHAAGVLDFVGGVVGTLITSFDVQATQLPWMEIYGTEGTLSLPDPNTFDGPVRLRRVGERAWREISLSGQFSSNSRGLGVADLASAIQNRRLPRASGDLAYHVLEIMHAIHQSSESGRHIELTSRIKRPTPLTPGEFQHK